MASGYLTSDGKDLDTRYLGINAKAKSASTADTATTANGLAASVDVSANAKLTCLRTVKVYVEGAADWDAVAQYTFPASGLFVVHSLSSYASSERFHAGYLKLDGVALFSSPAGDKNLSSYNGLGLGGQVVAFLVKKGSNLTYSGGGASHIVQGQLFVTVN